jgi:hypothetical protein
MPSPTSQKLKIKQDYKILVIHEPASFLKSLEPLPKGVKVSQNFKSYNQVHWFVKNKSDMEKELDGILSLIKNDILCWIYYPKGTSKIQTDLTRDKGWEKLLSHHELQWITLISFDETWSAFGCRLKTESDEKKSAKVKQRIIFDYIDAEKKLVRIPGELEIAFTKNKRAHDFFNSLSFSNKKEYVEWIITAKKDETKKERISGTIEKLIKEWKNPRNL